MSRSPCLKLNKRNRVYNTRVGGESISSHGRGGLMYQKRKFRPRKWKFRRVENKESAARFLICIYIFAAAFLINKNKLYPFGLTSQSSDPQYRRVSRSQIRKNRFSSVSRKYLFFIFSLPALPLFPEFFLADSRWWWNCYHRANVKLWLVRSQGDVIQYTGRDCSS